jgi:NAD+ dependent glucose-6-phosphate dehydrogenase
MRPERPSDPGDSEGEGEAIRRPSHPTFDLPILDREDDDDELDDLDDDEEDDGLDDEDEALAEVVEEEPRTVLITGACGNIGRKLRAAWTDVYDLVLIDRVDEDDDPDVIVADLAVLDDDWITHFHGVDTVVHLAANPDSDAVWDELVEPNLDVLANVFHAAALAGVERVIFASSNHVMGGYRGLDDEPITVDREPLPDGPYGAAKLFGERLGRSLSRAFDLTFIALRLGWVQEGNNRAETLPDDWSRKLWLSNNDLVRLLDGAVEAEIEDRSYVVVNGMSRNHGMRWDLSDAAELLGYLPVDDAFAAQPAIEEPEESHP